MATMAQGNAATADREWFIVGRWQELAGETRTNLLRIASIGLFYLIELINYHLVTAPDADLTTFHKKVTALAVAWTMVSLAVLLCLRMRFFPPYLKYCSAGCDLLLLTALASIDHGPASKLADGPFSPVVLAYFLIISLAAVRFSLGLVWFSTLGSMLGYLALVGQADKTWFDADHAVPPVQTLITLASLGMTGIVMGQVVRRVRSLAEEYSSRLKGAKGSK